MDDLTLNKPNLSQYNDSRIFNEVGGLDNLRKGAQQNDKQALREVAKQFESIFVQMLMKSMREANAAFESDSPFNSQYTKFYEQMQDQQMAMDLSQSGSFGLAELMVQQLSPEDSNVTPASVLRGGDSTGAKSTTPEQQLLIRRTTGKKTPQAAEIAATPPTNSTVEQATATDVSASGWKTPQEFVNSLLPMAEKAASKLGLQPAVLIAQSALETGWGQKIIKHTDGSSSHNLFNIKADSRWGGPKAEITTTEYYDGTPLRQKADFRSYDSPMQSFQDFVDFLTGSERYQQTLQQSSDPASFLHSLQQAGYATDPNYADKVLSVLRQVNSHLPK